MTLKKNLKPSSFLGRYMYTMNNSETISTHYNVLLLSQYMLQPQYTICLIDHMIMYLACQRDWVLDLHCFLYDKESTKNFKKIDSMVLLYAHLQ